MLANDLVKEAQLNRGLTQQQVAKKLGYSNAQFVSNMERKMAGVPPKTIRKISKVLDLDPQVLVDALVASYRSDLERMVR